RFSLAHELCHLIVDLNQGQPLATVSEFLGESHLPREQRANSFAVRLLCPEAVLNRLAATGDEVEAAKHVMAEYGLHYAAARLYLKNVAHMDLPPAPPLALMQIANLPKWQS